MKIRTQIERAIMPERHAGRELAARLDTLRRLRGELDSLAGARLSQNLRQKLISKSVDAARDRGRSPAELAAIQTKGPAIEEEISALEEAIREAVKKAPKLSQALDGRPRGFPSEKELHERAGEKGEGARIGDMGCEKV